jgi:nitroreductase
MGLTAQEAHSKKLAPATDGVLPVFLHRWSSRAFADRPVSTADLKLIFEATRWSASAYNEQPWRFIVGAKGSEAFEKILDSLIGFNKGWAASAPVLILGVTKRTFAHNGTDNSYDFYDLGSAVGQLTLQAAALGMTTHQMAGFERDKARELFSIPADYELGIAVALGYQGEPELLSDEKLRAMESSERQRKSLEELVFSSWGTPAQLG